MGRRGKDGFLKWLQVVKVVKGLYKPVAFKTSDLPHNIPFQSEIDALTTMVEDAFKKGNATLLREVISLLESQGHDCADAKDKLLGMVKSPIKNVIVCFLFSENNIF